MTINMIVLPWAIAGLIAVGMAVGVACCMPWINYLQAELKKGNRW